METQAEKRIYIISIVFYVILFLGNIWCAIDSFCDYAETLKTKTLIKGIIFFVFIFFFAREAIVEYKLHKARKKADDEI